AERPCRPPISGGYARSKIFCKRLSPRERSGFGRYQSRLQARTQASCVSAITASPQLSHGRARTALPVTTLSVELLHTTAAVAAAKRSMSLEEDVVLPTAHAQQNLPDERHVVHVLGVDRDLGLGARRDLVFRVILVGDIDDGDRAAVAESRFRLDQAR